MHDTDPFIVAGYSFDRITIVSSTYTFELANTSRVMLSVSMVVLLNKSWGLAMTLVAHPPCIHVVDPKLVPLSQRLRWHLRFRICNGSVRRCSWVFFLLHLEETKKYLSS